MKFNLLRLLASALLVAAFSAGAFATGMEPLFINMTTGASMAIGFGKNQLERNHPLTVFLNDKGVSVASLKNASRFGEQQKMLADIIAKGGRVIVCPTCMKHFKIKEADLIAGAVVGHPDLTGQALFAENTRALSW